MAEAGFDAHGDNNVGRSGEQRDYDSDGGVRDNSSFEQLCNALARDDVDTTSFSTQDSGCKLDDAKAQALVDALTVNTRLRHIHLDLQSLGNEKALMLAACVARCPQLKTLTLLGHRLIWGRMKRFQDRATGSSDNNKVNNDIFLHAMSTNQTIQKLVLCTMDFSAKALAQLLSESTNLSTLCFSGCGNSCIRSIAKATALHGSRLTRLELYKSRASLVNELIKEAVQMSNLRELHFKSRKMSAKLASSLKGLLESGTPGLRELHFSRCEFHAEDMDILAKGLAVTCHIKALRFDDSCEFHDRCIGCLGGALQANTSLAQYEGIGCRLWGGQETLFLGLSQSISLKFLAVKDSKDYALQDIVSNLERMNLNALTLGLDGWSGSHQLFKALTRNRELVKVDLSDCQLRPDDFGDLLAQALNHSKALSELKLGPNMICDAGLRSLVHALSSTQSNLKHLYMNRNSFSHNAIKDLCLALGGNHIRLTTLSLEYCLVTDETYVSLFDMLTTNTYLEELFLRGRELGLAQDAFTSFLESVPMVGRLKALSIAFQTLVVNDSSNRDNLVNCFRRNRTLTNVMMYPESDFFDPCQKMAMKFFMLRNKNSWVLNDPFFSVSMMSLWPHMMAANFRHSRLNGDGCSNVFHCLRSGSGAIMDQFLHQFATSKRPAGLLSEE